MSSPLHGACFAWSLSNLWFNTKIIYLCILKWWILWYANLWSVKYGIPIFLKNSHWKNWNVIYGFESTGTSWASWHSIIIIPLPGSQQISIGTICNWAGILKLPHAPPSFVLYAQLILLEPPYPSSYNAYIVSRCFAWESLAFNVTLHWVSSMTSI